MRYLLLADAIALIHVLFVFFVVFGSFFVLRWPRAVWLHVPALAWGVCVEWSGATCPLTPLENRLRVLGGEAGYSEDFLSHWLFMILYPEMLTRGLQVALGAAALVLNIGLYTWIWRKNVARLR